MTVTMKILVTGGTGQSRCNKNKMAAQRGLPDGGGLPSLAKNTPQIRDCLPLIITPSLPIRGNPSPRQVFVLRLDDSGQRGHRLTMESLAGNFCDERWPLGRLSLGRLGPQIGGELPRRTMHYQPGQARTSRDR